MRRFVLVLMFASGVVHAKPAPPTTERWEAEITITSDSTTEKSESAVHHTGTEHGAVHSDAHISAQLDAFAVGGGWQSLKMVKMTGSGVSHSTLVSHAKDTEIDADHHVRTTDTSTESNDSLDPTLTKPDELSFTAGPGGIVVTGNLYLKGSTVSHLTITTNKGTHKDTTTTQDSAPSQFDFEGEATQAMIDSRHFTGTYTDTGDAKTNAALGIKQSTVVTIDIHPLGPKAEVELVVDGADYQKWIPDPKTPLVLTATLRAKSGKLPADLKLSKLHVKLTGTSTEPGESMNWPLNPTSNDKDLGLTGSDAIDIGSDKQEIEIPRAKNTEQFAVVAYDYGGWADLVVTGDLTDGRTITAHLTGKPEGPIKMPYRTGSSKIAEEWKKQAKVTGKDDDDDAEEKPEGKKDTNGDGFSLYEEYRGAECNGAHIRLDPTKKDLFIRNEIGNDAKTGIGYFRAATGLEVHDCLTAAEMPASRVVNVNRKDGAHVVDQHALDLRMAPDDAPSAAAEAIGTPGEVDHVTVNNEAKHVATQGQLDWDASVGHELLHGLGVEHHGEQDQTPVFWEYDDKGGMIERGSTASAITVEDENGKPIKRTDWQMKQLFVQGGVLSVPLYVAYPHGETSGDDNCLMRYADALPFDVTFDGVTKRVYFTIFVDVNRPSVRHLVAQHEKVGVGLCTSNKGTGTNDPHHRPFPWHSSAQRGDCAHQFVVSDRYPISQHPPKNHH